MRFLTKLLGVDQCVQLVRRISRGKGAVYEDMCGSRPLMADVLIRHINGCHFEVVVRKVIVE